MRRVSTDLDYLRDGTIVIDADGFSATVAGPQATTGAVEVNDMFDDFVSGRITLERSGNVCTLTFTNVIFSTMNLKTRATLPVGYRPSQAATGMSVPLYSGSCPSSPVLVDRTGSVRLRIMGEGAMDVALVWTTPDPAVAEGQANDA